MPTEDRTIIFSPLEVNEAMAAFATRRGAPMPAGALDGIRFDPEGHPALIVTLRQAGTPVPSQIAFSKAEVAAALILFCKAKGVPLPRDCSKQLVLHNGRPAFHIVIA